VGEGGGARAGCARAAEPRRRIGSVGGAVRLGWLRRRCGWRCRRVFFLTLAGCAKVPERKRTSSSLPLASRWMAAGAGWVGTNASLSSHMGLPGQSAALQLAQLSGTSLASAGRQGAGTHESQQHAAAVGGLTARIRGCAALPTLTERRIAPPPRLAQPARTQPARQSAMAKACCASCLGLAIAWPPRGRASRGFMGTYEGRLGATRAILWPQLLLPVPPTKTNRTEAGRRTEVFFGLFWIACCAVQAEARRDPSCPARTHHEIPPDAGTPEYQ
jgi:hypothetical protein